ncbi:cupin domain-containing protein [Chitinasiproducens palmae]|uniref:Cupin domain-containing protein n=1 Tax=Chitinasiproducens palmae TaxID=1770053 RepID=A0A1H2PTX5_9BURK|nr:cupin domain-containing protein [Chitinasiproducens palmae]SDV50594.1 Cupin domain-containing protein [Chitinasiproducens palmae]
MDKETFLDELDHDGFTQRVVVTRAAGLLPDHAHPFEARALILSGDIEIVVDGQRRTYRTGEVFRLAAGQRHEERYGADGVQYLVGRR